MTPGVKPRDYYRDAYGYHPIFGLSSFVDAGEVAALLGNDEIKDSMIDWGTGSGQVSAVDVPIADAGDRFTGTEVETALQELAGDGRTTETVKANATAITGKVSTTRQVIAGVGLSGGGDLSADRTLTVAIPTLHVQDQKAANTAGGTFTSGSWQTRDLNTVVTNTITGASLASNQITLPAGTYHIFASAPAHAVYAHKAKLYDITNSADLIIGTSEYTHNTSPKMTRSFVQGRFTLAAETVVELQHRCGTTIATAGFGTACNFAVVEVYSDVEIQKVA